jgi:hypothetical protein
MGKKIYISESKLKRLYEYHNQMVIPFETIKDENGNTLFYGNDNGRKLNYQHFMDFLESFGKKGTLQPSDFNWKEAIDESLLDTFDMLCEEYSEKYQIIDDMFYGYYRVETFVEIIRNLIPNAEFELLDNNTKIKITFEDFSTEVEVQHGYSEFFDIITNLFSYDEDDFLSFVDDEDKKNYVKRHSEEYDFPDGIKTDERGLIYVERELTIPFYLDNSFNGTYSNFYNRLNNDYGEHVGQYWSWNKDCGHAYNGNNYNNKYTRVVLCGYVDPKSVDWKQTTMKSCWSYKEEQEIEIEYGEEVEVDAIYLKTDRRNRINLLKEPMIVYA